MEDEIKFSKSQKNKPIIIYQNHIYHCEKTHHLTSYWSCENKKKGCEARIKLFDNEFNSLNQKEHNHLTCELKRKTLEFKNKLKRKAEDDPADSLKNPYDSVVLQVFYSI